MRLFLRFLVVPFLFLLLAGVGWFFWASAPVQPAATDRLVPYPVVPAVPRDTFTVMTWNIGYLSGMTNNLPTERTEAFVNSNLEVAVRLLADVQPDVVALQEIDFAAARSFDVNQADTLAKRGRFAAVAEAVNWDERYVPFPYGWPQDHFGRVRSGQAVLSRHPITGQERVVLERPSNPFWYDAFYLDRLAQVVKIDLGGQPLILINVHLEAWDAPTRNRQAGHVQQLYQQYAAQYPVLVLGDFNSVLPQDTTALPAEDRAWLDGDRAAATLVQTPGLVEAFATLRQKTTGTYPADTPRYKIDHIFYSTDRLQLLDAWVADSPTHPSDHRAVVMRFVRKALAAPPSERGGL
jgi:endonuclease/exonuclease/phosphatase family metal-dependent hydrolase